MAKFIKRQIVIEANQWMKMGDHPSVDAFNPSGELPNGSCPDCSQPLNNHGYISTQHAPGEVVCPGDYVIVGMQGEIYSCKPAMFDATFEPAGDNHV